MIVYFTAMLLSMAYCLSIPVSMYAQVRFPEDACLAIGVRLFGRTVYQKEISSCDVWRMAHRRGNLARGGSFRAYRYLFRHTQTRLIGQFSMFDACQTAQTAAALNAIAGLMRVGTSLRADFLRPSASLTGLCICSTKLGHIIFAALWRLTSSMVWRGTVWRNTRSKAS